MIVLSLFDGMGCGLAALKKAGIPVTKYYASEIDKAAIEIAKKNHPEIEHLGDINHWPFWDIEKPDLIMGGSPCQGFSYAGKRLNFEDPRSKLFFKMTDIIDYYKPKYRLLENVKMKQIWLDAISDRFGVKPIRINSALVSAQKRDRFYWCNWKVPQPKDKNILIKDVINFDIEERNTKSWHNWWYKNAEFQIAKKYSCVVNDCDKAITMTARQYGSYNGNFVKLKRKGRGYLKASDKVVDKIPALTSSRWEQNNKISINGNEYRKLTPIECERLQTLPDNYTAGVSAVQRYKMLGNGWTLDVIVHLFKQAPFHPCFGILS